MKAAGKAPVQPRRAPFRYGTRQRYAPVVSSQAWAPSARSSVELPRVGFLAEIWVRVSGSLGLSTTTGAAAVFGPWNALSEMVVRVNIGASTIYRTSGFGNYLLQRLMSRPNDPTNSPGTADADIYAVNFGASGSDFALTYRIPIAQNYGRQSHLGLINLQAPEIQVNLDLLTGAYADIGTAVQASGTTLTYDVGYLYYEVPNPNKAAWPPLVFFRTIQDQQNIAAVGDQIYTFPREGIVHRLAHMLVVNSVRNNANFVRNTIRFNKTDEVYRYNRWEMKLINSAFYGYPLPTGCFVHDWWAAEGEPGEGDNRDFISSEALSTLESIVNVDLATATATLYSIRQFTQVVRL